MDSIKANVFTTAKYLPYFTDKSVKQFKSCMFEQLGCNNEAEFLHKVLTNIQHILTHESSTIIKNKAIQIAESQIVKNNSNNNNLTIYKYVEQQQNQSKDIFSRLHSNIIDEFGSYLTKKESIIFGYLNKYTFIETQKRSFLLARYNDKEEKLRINNSMIPHLHLNGIPFAYSIPTTMILEFMQRVQPFVSDQERQVMNSQWFKQLFLRLNNLTVFTSHLNFIPFDLLFYSDKNDDCKQFLQDFTVGARFFDDVEKCIAVYEQVNSTFKSFIITIETSKFYSI